MVTFKAHFWREKIINLITPLVAFGLQSCANTEIGKELSNSFDILPVGEEKSSDLDNLPVKSVGDKFVNRNNNRPVEKDLREKTYVVKSNRAFKEQINQTKPDVIPFTPRPYRITIKLSGANPSAPAQTVTKALIKAGVQFEVEKIERVEIVKNKKRL